MMTHDDPPETGPNVPAGMQRFEPTHSLPIIAGQTGEPTGANAEARGRRASLHRSPRQAALESTKPCDMSWQI